MVPTHASEAPQAPKLFFEYSWLYDENCSNTPDRKIDPAWSKEAQAKTGEFTKAWNRSGPTLYGKLFEAFGKGFSRKEMTATLSVCPTHSYSNPLVLNINKYLVSYTDQSANFKGQTVEIGDSFAALVFHELLHTWVGENVGSSTPLLEKYKNEDPVVRNHLHVMALQKFVYVELGRKDLLKMLNKQYTTMPSADYRRAWAIVDQIEGYEKFIAEVRK